MAIPSSLRTRHFSTSSSGWGRGSHRHWQGWGTPEVHRSPDLTWGRWAPGSHRRRLSVRVVRSPGLVHSWCKAHRAVACRPGAISYKNGRRASGDPAYGPAFFIRQRCLLGEGVSGYALDPSRGSRALASWPDVVWARFLAGRAVAACTRSPTKGATRFLRACFMVFPLSTSLAIRTPALSTGPLRRGMAKRNSPLKILPRPCPRWYRAPANGVMVVTTMMMSEPPCLCLRAESNRLAVWALAWLRKSHLETVPFGLDRPLWPRGRAGTLSSAQAANPIADQLDDSADASQAWWWASYSYSRQ